MKAWGAFIFLCLPFVFFFEKFEYTARKIQQLSTPYLLPVTLLVIIFIAILTKSLSTKRFLTAFLISLGISCLLSRFFIPNDRYWFTPVDRNTAILFFHIVYFLGLIAIRTGARALFGKL